jgi:SAM-dependent methyltransferase
MCGGTGLQKVMSLTPTPPGNDFLTADELSRPEPVYPLDLYFCPSCHHVQLGHVVNPRILYQKHYTYVSGTSPVFVDHLLRYAAAMVPRFGLAPDSLVADLGSNDGTGLRFFKEAGMRVLGVDPATEIAARATAAGIGTVPEFFSAALAETLRRQHGPARFITTHNTCAHIDDLDDVMHGVRHWLADDGVFVLEVGYLLDVYRNTWFDTIYHEHLDYHTVGPFKALLSRAGMEPFAVERVSPQGGSIRLFAQRRGGPQRADGSLDEAIALERAAGLDRAETFCEFGRRIDEVGTRLRALLGTLKAQGRSIAGYGAPTKATTLMSHFGLGRHELDFIVDDNPLKQGLFSPASHIPVLAPAELYRRRPDFVVILAWNFAAPIMEAHRRLAAEGGRFIVPMPEPGIVE